jgi:hypothetical protein
MKLMMLRAVRRFGVLLPLVGLCISGVGLAANAVRGHGSCTGRITSTPLGGGLVALDLDVAGTITHLGKSTVQIHTLADFSGAVPAPIPPTTGVVTAANGDTVSFTLKWSVEEVTPNVYLTTGPFEITGGTGRFAAATGGGEYRGLVNLASGAVSAEIAGAFIR